MHSPTPASPGKVTSQRALALRIQASPTEPGCATALRFLEAALAQHRTISLIFFNGQGVQIADEAASDEHRALKARWIELSSHQALPLVLCAGSAHAHGLQANHLDPPFVLGSLTQLLDAYATNDQVVAFQP